MDGKLIRSLALTGGRIFSVVIHDLLQEPVDAIVNAANGRLAHGGGVAAVIARAAGAALKEEGDKIVEERGEIPVGEAVVTTGGRLSFKGVIHAIGPQMGQGDEENKLVQALQSAFMRATERGWKSLSFPAVSAGIFAVPLESCARAYVRAVVEFFRRHPESSLKEIRLCLLQGPLVDLISREIDARD